MYLFILCANLLNKFSLDKGGLTFVRTLQASKILLFGTYMHIFCVLIIFGTVSKNTVCFVSVYICGPSC